MKTNSPNDGKDKVLQAPKRRFSGRLIAWSIVLLLVVVLVAFYLLPGFPAANVFVDGKQLNGEPIQIGPGASQISVRGDFCTWIPYDGAPMGASGDECQVRVAFQWGTGSESQIVPGQLSKGGCVLSFVGSVPRPRTPESGKLSIAILPRGSGRDRVIFTNPVAFVH
jgi:hypothetical protein